MSLGGLYGVNSAIKDIEKAERAKRLRTPTYDDGIDLSFYKTNDNRYAWRLNCEDGSDYGIYPDDYETREEYNEALSETKEGIAGDDTEQYEEVEYSGQQNKEATDVPSGVVIFCRVSLLNNGKTVYYRTDDPTIKCGEIVIVSDGDGTTSGVVVSAEAFSPGLYPQPIESTGEIIGRASDL